MPKKKKNGIIPPRLWKFCLFCKRYNRFEYNRNVLHSECVVCGCRFGKKNKWD